MNCQHSVIGVTNECRAERRSAFTLIELLVVIAIIAILAAILFPVFAQAREKARQTACLSNTKQMGLGIYQYVQDYDETLPLGYSRNGVQRTWYQMIDPYVKSNNLARCPSDISTNIRVGVSNGLPVVAPGPGTSPIGTGSYGCNRNLMESARSRPIADLQNPAGTFIVCESAQLTALATAANVEQWNTGKLLRSDTTGSSTDWQVTPPSGFSPIPGSGFSNSTTYLYATAWTTPGEDNYRRPVPRHNGGLNIIYADGHAKWSKITQFLGIPSNGVDPAPSNKGWLYGSPNNTWDDK